MKAKRENLDVYLTGIGIFVGVSLLHAFLENPSGSLAEILVTAFVFGVLVLVQPLICFGIWFFVLWRYAENEKKEIAKKKGDEKGTLD